MSENYSFYQFSWILTIFLLNCHNSRVSQALVLLLITSICLVFNRISYKISCFVAKKIIAAKPLYESWDSQRAPKTAPNGLIEMSQHGKQFVIKTKHRNEILKRGISLVSTGARWKFGRELPHWFQKWVLVHRSLEFSSFLVDVTTGKSVCHSHKKSDRNSEKRILSDLYWGTPEIAARAPELIRKKVGCSSNRRNE